MKIAILTSGILPIPAIRNGAVENLIDAYLAYNDQYRLHDITVYSIKSAVPRSHPALQSNVNHYRYIDGSSGIARLRKWLYMKKHGWKEYYNYNIEYFYERVAHQLKRHAYDVIIIENRPGFAVKLQQLRLKAKLVYHLHNDFLNNTTNAYEEIYRAASLIINVSDFITSRVRTIAANDTKCRTVYNGIDIQRFNEALPLDRKEVGIDNNDFVVVYSGRLNKEKGILELVRAIALLNDIPKLKLLIIGASFYGQDEAPTQFVRELRDAAEPIHDKVVFTGFIDYAQIPSYLKMADVAVVPSMWEEPFGLTVVEAMAAGLPLITTRSGGIPEICEGMATIVNKENIEGNLANAITDFYKHPEERKQISKKLLEQSKLFNKETYARNFFKAIEDGLQ